MRIDIPYMYLTNMGKTMGGQWWTLQYLAVAVGPVYIVCY